jgi:hypothetical protein
MRDISSTGESKMFSVYPQYERPTKGMSGTACTVTVTLNAAREGKGIKWLEIHANEDSIFALAHQAELMGSRRDYVSAFAAVSHL